MQRPRRIKISSVAITRIAPWFLLLFVFIFMLQTLAVLWPDHKFGSVFLLIIVGGICIYVFQPDWKNQAGIEAPGVKKTLKTILALGMANVLTFVLTYTLGLSAVVASALVGLIGGVFFPTYSAAIFCGSFVGMSSQAILADIAALFLSSLIAGVLYAMSEQWFDGIGGKLGTIAFIGSVMTGIVFQNPFSATLVPPDVITGTIIAVSALAAFTTWALGNFGGLGAVIASAVVGLAGGIVMPLVWPEYGELIAVAIFCGSFAGMSSKARFSGVMMVIAGLLCGIVFAASLQVFGGAGGKLGMTAFSVSLAVLGYQQMFDRN